MDQKQAIVRLGKLLGEDFAYRVDKHALRADERSAMLAKHKAAIAAVATASEALEARRKVILAADADYQRLVAERVAAVKARNNLPSCHAKPITVGRSGSLFFSVVADGDTWAEVVEKVENQS
jgi:hypothetical protein